MTPHCYMLQTGDIQMIVGDDSRNGSGGQQYSGLWSLTHRVHSFNAFGNSFAGLLASDLRGVGCRIQRDGEHGAMLISDATDERPTDAVARYAVAGPDAIDFSLSVTDHGDRLNYLSATPFREVAACCYMNSLSDARLRFRMDDGWWPYMSPQHGVGSHLAPSYLSANELEVPPAGEKAGFHWDRISRRFDQPFYFGRIDRMYMLLVFDQPKYIRYFLSPTGGGSSLAPGQTCPAWDYEWIIPECDYQTGRQYDFRLRMIFSPYVSDACIFERALETQASLGFEKV